MIWYEWKIKVDKQTWAQGTAPDKEGALSEIELYLMQYQEDWINKLEVVVQKKENVYARNSNQG